MDFYARVGQESAVELNRIMLILCMGHAEDADTAAADDMTPLLKALTALQYDARRHVIQRTCMSPSIYQRRALLLIDGQASGN